MARRKKTSSALANGRQRESSLRAIDPNLRFSDDLNLAKYTEQLDDLDSTLAEYNTLLSRLDGLSEAIATKETQVRKISENMLLSVRIRYGRNSQQYRMAGGSTPKRKNSIDRTAPEAPTAPAATNGSALPDLTLPSRMVD